MSVNYIGRSSVLLLTMALSLSACGGGDADTGGSAAVDDETAEPVEDDTAEPVEGSEVDVAAPFGEAVANACQPEKSPRIQEIQERGTLEWGIGVSPPFGFKDSDGEWAGVEADNAEELAEILGVDYRIQDYDYSVMTGALNSNRADIVGAQLFITDERAEAIDFSVPYYLSGQLFYVLEDSSFETIEDLNVPENRFVYGTGGAQEVLAEKFIPNATISDAPLRGQLLLYEFLISEQADSTMTEAAPLKVLTTQYQNLAAIGLNGRIEGDTASPDDVLDPFDVAFGLPPGDEGWKACVDAWVEEALESGRMKDRIDYWLGQNLAG